MANAPIQIVLNADNFRVYRETQAPKSAGKDFFLNDDAGFAKHKSQIATQIQGLKTAISNPQFGEIGFAKVTLRRSALAKSHRPTRTLFNPRRTPIVGGAGLGQILCEVTPESLDQVAKSVELAEATSRTRIDKKTGES